MTKDKPGDGSAVKRCIDAFYAAFVRFHNPAFAESWLAESAAKVPPAERTVPQVKMVLPLIKGGKDASHMKHLLATYGEERVTWLIAEFFGPAYRTFGVINSNQDIGALYSVAPRLLVRDRSTMQPRRTNNNLDAAARAMATPSYDRDRERLQLPAAKEAK